jgi:hypothetical protein
MRRLHMVVSSAEVASAITALAAGAGVGNAE